METTNTISYQYDEKQGVLLKLKLRDKFQIMVKSEGPTWRTLDTRKPLDNEYGLAIWFGSGASDDLYKITEEEANKIIDKWKEEYEREKC